MTHERALWTTPETPFFSFWSHCGDKVSLVCSQRLVVESFATTFLAQIKNDCQCFTYQWTNTEKQMMLSGKVETWRRKIGSGAQT